MTEDEEAAAERFIKAFREQMHHVDEFIQVVLNGHLEIEGELDTYLDRIFAHPKHLRDARLSFYQKVCITRAYTPLSRDRPEWAMMILFNSIRNKIAHRSRHDVLQVDMREIRSLVQGVAAESYQSELETAEHKEVMIYAAALCSAYLSIMEEQLAAYKGEAASEEE